MYGETAFYLPENGGENMGILDYDSPVMETISRITDYVLLTFLTLICCIPIFTIGAAFTAKYYVSMKMVKGEEPVVFKAFFHSFRENLKQTSVLTGIVLLVSLFIGYDWYLIFKTNVEFVGFMKYLLGFLTLLLMMSVFSLFPIVSRFQIKTFEAIKSALIFSLANFLRVVFAIAMIAVPVFVALWYFKWAWLILLFSSVTMLYFNSMFFVKKFKALEEANGFIQEDEGEVAEQ